MRIWVEVELQTSFTCPKGHFVMEDTDLLYNGQCHANDQSIREYETVYCKECVIYDHNYGDIPTVYKISELKSLRIEICKGTMRTYPKKHREYLVSIDTEKEKLRVERILKDSEGVK